MAYKDAVPISNNRVQLIYLKKAFLFNQVYKRLYINYLINRKVLGVL